MLASDDGARIWSWEGARFLVALAAMFYLACLAFLSVTEGLGRDMGRCRKQAIASVVFGIPAALSMRDGYAAFLMFLLLGFSLNFGALRSVSGTQGGRGRLSDRSDDNRPRHFGNNPGIEIPGPLYVNDL